MSFRMTCAQHFFFKISLLQLLKGILPHLPYCFFKLNQMCTLWHSKFHYDQCCAR